MKGIGFLTNKDLSSRKLLSVLTMIAVYGILLPGCKSKDQPPLFDLVDQSGIEFVNKVTDSKTDNSFYFRNFYNGGGVAIGDINNDGLSDVILTANMGDNKLYLNKGNWKFDDITAKSGMKQDSMWSTGVVMADVNGDGWLDIYICNSGHIQTGHRRNKLYINNHDLSFTESAAAYGLDVSGYCTQASFLDYDLDGDLDCFLINNSPLPFSSLNYADMRDANIDSWKGDENLKGGGNHLYRNDNNHFTEVTKEAGMHTGLISFGLGVTVSDINQDGYPDIYVGNDFIEKDYLYINQRNGIFKDILEQSVQQISMSSMSTDVADINNDGLPDIFTTDMIPDDDYRLKTTGTYDNIELYLSKQKAGLYHQYVKNCLQLNNGNGTFSEISNYSGVYGTDWSWGAVFLDADNDGLNDIFVCNGINRDVGDLDFLDFFSNEVYQKMVQTGQKAEIDEILKHIPVTPLSNRVFKNQGNLRFKDIAKEWGLDQKGFSNSIAYGDLDNDGDLDLIINNENLPSFIYRNNSREQNKNNYIGVSLKGKGSNTYAIGSKIRVYKANQVFYRELSPSRGFQSSMDYKQIIGLGELKDVDSLVIDWPDGAKTKLASPKLNEVHKLEQPKSTNLLRIPSADSVNANTLLHTITAPFDRHKEDDYIDFYYERNLPELLSREGPCITKGDVNGDGLDDVYIGGGKGQGGQLYLQSAIGFTKKDQPAFKGFENFEETAALLFDADKDGDLDLFIGAGGNNEQPGSRELQHRLYINDGKGNFSLDARAFPVNDMNIAVVICNDYDGDGDLDLFVGSRSTPYNYGVIPQSYIYNNDGKGHFTDVTNVLSPAIKELGMVTGAVWEDLNGDRKAELVITGEWMHTRIFSYNGKTKIFDEWNDTGLQDLQGWWQGIGITDIDGDGKKDLVIGNIGENFYLRPTQTSPVKLWVTDFDHNGTREQFLTRTIDKRDMPVFLKREITDQFPGLKKQNLRHADYAKKSIQQLFGDDVLKGAGELTFNYCSSIIAINQGNGKFRVQPLPQLTQLSSVKGICSADINGDGREDLLLGGNLFTFPPQFGRLDASYGHVLLNDGKGNYNWLAPKQSGLSLAGEIKNITTINRNSKPWFLICRNNEQPVFYTTEKINVR